MKSIYIMETSKIVALKNPDSFLQILCTLIFRELIFLGQTLPMQT